MTLLSKDDLKKFNFEHTHNIELSDEAGRVPMFVNHKLVNQEPSIYIWAAPIDDQTFKVLYIGKAGYGLNKRFIQHASGFKHSVTGMKNASLITSHITSGGKIEVFVKIADKITLFGKEVSLYSTEEEAFCEAFPPLWNRADFPNQSKMLSKNLN
jgi:hypothetical protein